MALALALLLVQTRPALADFLRGMTVSCPRSGQIWGTPLMRTAIASVRKIGVRWVAVHPYARIARDGTVSYTPAAETGFLRNLVIIASESKTPLFWTPHLAYWGSFEWRGAVEFGDDAAAWARFFDGYRGFIVDQARFAQASGVRLFSVGNEYERTTASHEKEWRAIITAVRAVYQGELTYSANWDAIDKVPFWDALDTIAVQGYFPLSTSASPKRAELEAGWDAVLARLERISIAQQKKVLFAEIGYSRSARAAEKPWEAATEDTPQAIAFRALLLDVALDRIERRSFVRGMFWWKWIPGTAFGEADFSMQDPEAQSALARHWTAR